MVYMGLLVFLLDFRWELVAAPGFFLMILALAYRNVMYVWLLGVALVPLSVNLLDFVKTSALSLPSDLIAVGLLLLAIPKFPLLRRTLVKTWKHPIVIAASVYFLWLCVTILSSTMPIVSLKFGLNYFWYAVGFFFIPMIAFRHRRYLERWLWIAAPALVVVLLFVLVRHAAAGFSFQASYRVVGPFFPEKTVYAASIAVFAVGYIMLGFGYRVRTRGWFIAWGMAGLTTLAVILSYTRGAWLGMIAAVGLWFTLKYWRWMKYVMIAAVGFVLFILSLVFFDPNVNVEAETSNKRDLASHFLTAFDIEENVSNRERINRWISAYRMAGEKPIFGFGPGTYAFKYAPYQDSRYRTIISTNQGDVGSAHSEFMLSLAETGWPGAALTFVVIVVALVMGARGYLRAPDNRTRRVYAVALTGLVSFYLHALVNNFMDQDKIAIPIFACLAMIVALDTYHPNGIGKRAPEEVC
jgi:O-antigen ligase